MNTKFILTCSIISLILSSCTIWRSGTVLDAGQKFPSERIIEGKVIGHSKAYYVFGIGKTKKEALMHQAYRQMLSNSKIDSGHALENIILDKRYSGFTPIYFKVEYLVSADLVRYPELKINNKRINNKILYDNILPNGKLILEHGYYMPNIHKKISNKINYNEYNETVFPAQISSLHTVNYFYDSLKSAYIPMLSLDESMTKNEIIHAYKTNENRFYYEVGIKLKRKSFLEINFIQKESKKSNFNYGDRIAFKYDLENENTITMLGHIYYGIFSLIEIENKGIYLLKFDALEDNFILK